MADGGGWGGEAALCSLQRQQGLGIFHCQRRATHQVRGHGGSNTSISMSTSVVQGTEGPRALGVTWDRTRSREFTPSSILPPLVRRRRK